MSLRANDEAAQEIMGFMLALAAVMILFGAAVGYGIAKRDQRVEDAAQVAVDDIAGRLVAAVNDAAIWATKYPTASLNLTVPLARMPGATGFITGATDTTLFVNASNDRQASVGHLSTVPIVALVSGNPDEAIVRYDPNLSRIILETP